MQKTAPSFALRFVALAAPVVLVAAAGCSSAPDPTSEAASSEAELAGCRTICPKCKPNQPCPMIACYLDCSSKKPGSCTQDSDCRLFDDYCTGCDCRALSTNQKDPTCSGPGVRCLVEPCAGHAAVCVAGQCAVQ